MARWYEWLEHTCAGFGSADCEACRLDEPCNMPGPEDGLGQSDNSWRYYEPEEWDVVGGL